MKKNRLNFSIRNIIIITFVLVMMISATGIGHFIFSNWLKSIKQTTENISSDISDSLASQIKTFMHIPEHINEYNHKFIESDILDLSDEELRDKFFAGVLSTQHDDIYSFGYATENGDYYAARRNEKGTIEILKNNKLTGGKSFYYSVNRDFTSGKLVKDAGKFDARTRVWYKAAKAAGAPTFSTIYKHFVMDDLTISAAWPIYDDAEKFVGVMATHMLLSDIGNFLAETITKYDGLAIIIEKETENLVANSMGINSFSSLSDGSLERYNISKIGNDNIIQAYSKYKENDENDFIYEGKKDNLIVSIRELNMEGFEWVIISTIPEDYYMEDVRSSMRGSAILIAITLMVALVVYNIITRKLLKPVKELIQVSESLSSGDLTKRVKVVKNNEIGVISKGLNKVADEMQYLINNLEASVEKRTEELHKTNLALEENRNQLQLILNSTAEAIYGIDLEGKCTFCNLSCIKMLGYKNQEELLEKNMHYQIHHTKRNNTPYSIENCKIFKSIKSGKGIEVDDEIFWRADGTSLEVKYHSYPQIRNGEIVGGVITFMDISERKKKEEEIKFLSCHDILTGLFNRRCLEESRDEIDKEENLPLSVIFADINGLKMTNDIFGHSAGDSLIKKSAEILTLSCRKTDLVARIGGDEFLILLPKTSTVEAEEILSRVKNEFSNIRVKGMKCNISLGVDTKTSIKQSLEEIMANAENKMYRDKALNRKYTNKDIIDSLIDTLHSRSDKEKTHSINVSELCGKVGSALNLSQTKVSKLKRAGYLHDIGKVTLDEELLFKENLTEEEIEKINQHPVVGYRILNLFDDTLDLAEHVYAHHEKWDGSGYPRGLKGEEISLISRIILITETYDRVLNNETSSIETQKQKALKVISEGSGKAFDPELAQLFIQIINKE